MSKGIIPTEPEERRIVMGKIALITDSTADLTREMQKELNIHVIPLKLRFEDEVNQLVILWSPLKVPDIR